MTKKEREELQQRQQQLEEAERFDQRRERSHSPYHDMPNHPEGPWRGPPHGYPPPPPRHGGHGPMRGNHSYYRMGMCVCLFLNLISTDHVCLHAFNWCICCCGCYLYKKFVAIGMHPGQAPYLPHPPPPHPSQRGGYPSMVSAL